MAERCASATSTAGAGEGLAGLASLVRTGRGLTVAGGAEEPTAHV
jgi:hypothetical protein